jgi:hypothetical protein
MENVAFLAQHRQCPQLAVVDVNVWICRSRARWNAALWRIGAQRAVCRGRVRTLQKAPMKQSLQIDLDGPASAASPGDPGRSFASVGIARPLAQPAPARSGALPKDLNCLPAAATFFTSLFLSLQNPPSSPALCILSSCLSLLSAGSELLLLFSWEFLRNSRGADADTPFQRVTPDCASSPK